MTCLLEQADINFKMQNTGKSESANPKIKEVRILSKTEHDNIVEFKVSGDLQTC